MNHVLITLLIKLKDKYSKISVEPITALLSELDTNWEQSKHWAEKTGLIGKSISELFNRLSIDEREEVFTKLFIKLYPDGLINKHPQKRVWLFKLGEHKFFYEVESSKVIMPVGTDEPRVFTADKFISNMPKLREFLDYLSTYSMRNRRRLFKP